LWKNYAFKEGNLLLLVLLLLVLLVMIGRWWRPWEKGDNCCGGSGWR